MTCICDGFAEPEFVLLDTRIKLNEAQKDNLRLLTSECSDGSMNWIMIGTEMLHPQQEDCNSCGMFVMMAMICICERKNSKDCIWRFVRNGNENMLDTGQQRDCQRTVACCIEKKSLHSSLKI